MAVKKDPTTAAANWATGMANAGPAYSAGVAAVRTAPGALAAASADLWANNVQAAKAKFSKNVAAVSLSAWQEAATNKGAGRLASGATAAQPKMQAFMAKFIPQLSSTVNSLPQRGTFEQNMNRLNTYIQGIHALKGQF